MCVFVYYMTGLCATAHNNGFQQRLIATQHRRSYISLRIACLQVFMVEFEVRMKKNVRKSKTPVLISSHIMLQMEYFQDDVLPDVRLSWEPCLTAEEWLDGSNATQVFISLKPSDMKSLSEAPKEAPKAMKYSSHQILTEKTDAEKKQEVRRLNVIMVV